MRTIENSQDLFISLERFPLWIGFGDMTYQYVLSYVIHIQLQWDMCGPWAAIGLVDQNAKAVLLKEFPDFIQVFVFIMGWGVHVLSSA
jgi:hypothetical protein